MRMAEYVIRERVRFAQEHGWDVSTCARAWGRSYTGIYTWIQKYKERANEYLNPAECKIVEIDSPVEYENQRLFDLYVMPMDQWCGVWGIPRHEYTSFLRMYERRVGHMIATPERREQWSKELECAGA